MSLQQPPLEGLIDYRLSDRTRIVHSLAGLRCEWQKIVEGKSLLDVEVPIGLILSDIADRLELTPQERHAMLGGKLINQVNCLMEDRISVRRAS
ncbi:MAG: hypothetical protein IH589_08755 [Anaerolineales bacterium]|nr:hypothetical protein [Anaerolineales bacterium]